MAGLACSSLMFILEANSTMNFEQPGCAVGCILESSSPATLPWPCQLLTHSEIQVIPLAQGTQPVQAASLVVIL